MSENLNQFLVDLASDFDRMAAFQADPDQLFNEAGLTGAERALLQSSDPRALAGVLNAAKKEGHGGSLPGPKKPKKGGKKGVKKTGSKKK